MAKHITLIGMMGAGKSSVAPLVAAPLSRPVYEVDQLIEKQEGMLISEIFIAKGEAYFRRIESAMITQLLAQPPAVFSLGGGAFQWEATRELLLAETVVFYLTASPDILISRLTLGRAARPLLNTPGIDLGQTIKDLIAKRSHYYEMAHYQVSTDFHDPDVVARAILDYRETYE